MRTGNFGLVVAVAAMTVMTGCANAPGTAGETGIRTGTLELRATGSGNWDVECVAVTARRGEIRSRRTRRNKHGHVACT